MSVSAVDSFPAPARHAIHLCALDDLIAGAGVAVLVDDTQIALFYLPDAGDPGIYAIGNHDPMSDAPVLSRGIVGDVAGELVVASPIYKQHFSLTTGACLEEAGVAVPTYRVLVSDDQVFLIR